MAAYPKINNILFIGLIFAFFFSCRETDSRKQFVNKQGLVVRRMFYEDGTTIKYEKTYKQDTIPHGYGKIFFPSGQLEFYTEFSNGKRTGKEVMYYKNGKMFREGWHKDNKKDSIWLWYDSLGRLQRKNNWKNGVLIGEQLEYYPDKRIKQCELYSPDGSLGYRGTYNQDGMLLGEEGERKIFIVIKTSHSIYDWKDGEVFNASIYFSFCGSNDQGILELKNTESNTVTERVLTKPGEQNFSYRINQLKKGEYILQAKCLKDDKINSSMRINVE